MIPGWTGSLLLPRAHLLISQFNFTIFLLSQQGQTWWDFPNYVVRTSDLMDPFKSERSYASNPKAGI